MAAVASYHSYGYAFAVDSIAANSLDRRTFQAEKNAAGIAAELMSS